MTDVLNLATGAWISYSVPPRAAVIAAHAQSLGDWNTWHYDSSYGAMVHTFIHGRTHVPHTWQHDGNGG